MMPMTAERAKAPNRSVSETVNLTIFFEFYFVGIMAILEAGSWASAIYLGIATSNPSQRPVIIFLDSRDARTRI